MKKSNPLKAIGIIVAILLVLLAGIPLILEHFIFRHSVYSVLTNGEWASFLGSYIGGVVGGAGTLIALWVTTKETRKVQDENLNQLKEDRQLSDKKERKQFADEIAKDIAAYITDISQYYYANCWSLDLHRRKNDAIQELEQIRSKILQNYTLQEGLDIENDIKEYNKAEVAINMLKVRESDAELKLRQVLDEMEENRANRTIAVERYFVLKIKLQHIEQAKELLEKLDSIHKVSSSISNHDPLLMDEETKLLKEMTVDFIDKYVNKNT